MVFCRQVVDKCEQQKKRDGARYAVPHVVFCRQILPLRDAIHHRRALVSSAVKMCKSLKASLLIADRHKCLAINDGRARLNAVIFTQVDLIHVWIYTKKVDTK